MKMDLVKKLKKKACNEECRRTTPQSIYEVLSSIEDLPNEILDYIFSFFDFVQRARIEAVCKRWCEVGRSPIQLKLDGKLLRNCKLNDSVVCSVLRQRGSALKSLTLLSSNTDLTSESLIKISQFIPNLLSVELRVLGIPQIAGLKTLGIGCPNLKVIRLEFLPSRLAATDEPANETDYEENYRSYIVSCDDGLNAIARSCRTLDRLYVYNLTDVSVGWMKVINPDIHSLCLYHTDLTSDALRCLMKTCKALREFAIYNCMLLDDGLLLQFLKHFRPTLRILSINYQDSFEGEWRKIFKVLSSLEVLHVNSYDILDDSFMLYLADNFESLRVLDIGYSRVTDVGLIELQGLTTLRHLTIGQFSRIQGFGLETLLSKGAINIVNIMPYNNELEEVCRSLVDKYPRVQFNILD